jgi:transcriptional regulator with XRE-family HTH domain
MGGDLNIQEEVRALNLGNQVRQLRQKRGLTLQNISDRTGLSKPLLSQIENHVAFPPIATLLKISKALGVTIGYFFQESPSASRLVLVRRAERQKATHLVTQEADGAGYDYESLAHPMGDKHMEPFLVHFQPPLDSQIPFYTHPGEEFIFVLEGQLEFRGADRVILLDPGDSLYFDSSISHALKGLGAEGAKALVVIYAQ